jgi:hypothetical protein
MRYITVFSLTASLVAGPASAAMFKWTDTDGNVQYGQYPPAGVAAKQIQANPGPANTPPVPSLQQQVEALDKQLAEQADQKAEAEKLKQEADNRKINCANARQNLDNLNLGGHRLSQLPDGSYERLSEEKRQELITKNKQAIEDFCDE